MGRSFTAQSLEKAPSSGIGAIVLDGAEVGRQSIVGSGSRRSAGDEDSRAIFGHGAPAKVVRKLDSQDLIRSKEQRRVAYDKSRKYLKIFSARSAHNPARPCR